MNAELTSGNKNLNVNLPLACGKPARLQWEKRELLTAQATDSRLIIVRKTNERNINASGLRVEVNNTKIPTETQTPLVWEGLPTVKHSNRRRW